MLTGEGFYSFSAMISLLCAAQAHKMPGTGFRMEYSPGSRKDREAAKAASGKAFFLKKNIYISNYIRQKIISLVISDVSNGAPGGGGGWG